MENWEDLDSAKDKATETAYSNNKHILDEGSTNQSGRSGWGRRLLLFLINRVFSFTFLYLWNRLDNRRRAASDATQYLHNDEGWGIIHPVLENQVHLSYPVYSPARVYNNNMGNARRRYLLAGLCGRLGVGGEDVECKYTEQITEDLQRHCSAINHIYSTEHSALAHHILNKYKTRRLCTVIPLFAHPFVSK